MPRLGLQSSWNKNHVFEAEFRGYAMDKPNQCMGLSENGVYHGVSPKGHFININHAC